MTMLPHDDSLAYRQRRFASKRDLWIVIVLWGAALGVRAFEETLRAGKGMGLAQAAELNGYPGPAHVLELAVQLELTPEQRAQTDALFQQMQSRAIRLGKALVEAERTLDQLFASRSITPVLLSRSLEHIGQLQGQLRQVHLEAHLEQTAVLTQQQIAKYIELRGYGTSTGHGRHGERHHELGR
jgi:Spy/CpxP family protein refolding chaperone